MENIRGRSTGGSLCRSGSVRKAGVGANRGHARREPGVHRCAPRDQKTGWVRQSYWSRRSPPSCASRTRSARSSAGGATEDDMGDRRHSHAAHRGGWRGVRHGSPVELGGGPRGSSGG
uniref:Uncharacterized protein n=1 Tax=uncultured marine virus TaxID=186617 RepID=A0A0F7L4Z5_9VIRU|nr:hypothetical protein [uncultured marine virus]